MQNEILEKYKEMARLRDDYIINPAHFLLPSMGEMVQEDLMSEILQQYIDGEDMSDEEKEILDQSFYTESPFSTSLGYHPDKGVFVLNAKALYESENCWEYNKMDGDTTQYRIIDIDDGGQPFTFTNRQKYSSFKDFFSKMNGGNNITLRHIGLNTPELPHFEVQAIPNNSDKFNVIEMTFKKVKELAKTNKKVVYLKHPVDKNRKKIVPRSDDEIVKMLKAVDDKGRTIYKEIINDNPTIHNKNPGYNYYQILFEDNSTAASIIDGYNCQKEVEKTLKSAKDILLVINANGINFGKKSPLTNMSFNSLYYMDDTADFMLNEWKKSYGDVPTTNYSYYPYGTDVYSRSLAAIYVRETVNNESRWVNVNKKVLAKSEHSVANPSYTSSPELQAIGAGLSEVFQTWSYDRDNIEYLDSFNSLTSKSYQRKLELHKKLTGIDFTESRNCSLMIGDTMLLVPPESIRNITQVFYERLPNMRSKGTMAKQVGQNEQMLEVTLYFYEDAGINGIPYTIETPSGDSLTYYMNGLRSLLAQFRVTPYLPIENGYINDVLGIEAVCMKNINIQTVEGFPRLLKVVLNLQEFNYRTFMPDLPIDDNDPNDSSKISELNPMFAKSFNWEIFRYYYQRSIAAGEILNKIEQAKGYSTYDYNLQFYTNKNTFQPFEFCSPPGMGSKISFYIPDELWLQNALQVKKNRDANLYTDQAHVELTEDAKKFCGELYELRSRLRELNEAKSSFWTNSLTRLFGKHGSCNHVGKLQAKVPNFMLGKVFDEETPSGKRQGILKKGIAESNGDNSILFVKDGKTVCKNEGLKADVIAPIRNDFLTFINDADYMTGMNLNETVFWNITKKHYEIAWDFVIKLNTSSITTDDLNAIKETLAKSQDLKIEKIFENNEIKVRYFMLLEPAETIPSGGLSGKGNIDCNVVVGSSGIDEVSTNSFVLDSSHYDYSALQALDSIIENEDSEENDPSGETPENAYDEAVDYYVKDYKNPANMPFVPYIENVPISRISSNMSNTFTDVNLKAIEGVGPQFLGGTDTTLEIEIVTDDIVLVNMFNQLPVLASATAKKFRRVLPAWPLKIKGEFTGLISISEVLIDTIEVSTVDGYPGVYTIAMRLTSVDRTQRQREALRRLDVKPYGGNLDVSSSTLAINKYFAIEKALSDAELYPDLDLPTINEMAKLGWRYVKYSGQVRKYPDPDFYLTYAYPYTSLIIKKTVKDVISKQLLNIKGKKELQTFKLKDALGMEVTAKVDMFSMKELSSDSDQAKDYDNILKNHIDMVAQSEKASKWTAAQKERILETLEEVDVLNYLTMCDIGDGWEIKPGMRAPLCDQTTNEAIKTDTINNWKQATKTKETGIKNVYAQSVREKRARAIELINKILDSPINYKDGTDIESKSLCGYQTASEKAVNAIFADNKYGAELINLLCPSLKSTKLSAVYGEGANSAPNDPANAREYENKFNEKYFKKLNPLTYLAGFLFASGCSLSGQEEFKTDANPLRWHPNHYYYDSVYNNYAYAQDEEYKKVVMPYIENERVAGRTTLSTTIKGGINTGRVFGAWRLKQYPSEGLISDMMFKDDDSVIYTTKYYDEIYRDKNNADGDKNIKRYIRKGYLDPYYNLHSENRKTIEKYNKAISLSKEANAEAFLRVVLTHLKKMILDGLIFSEIDVMLEDFSYFYNKFRIDNPLLILPTAGIQQPMTSDATAELEALGVSQEQMSELVLEIQKSFERGLCARLIYPFIAAVTENDSKVYDLFRSRDYNALDNLIGYVENSDQTGESNNRVYKFLSCLSGIEMTLTNDKTNTSSVSPSQLLMNNMMKDIYISASDDPRAYLMHSFYDMLVNDKRGRLVRAFPTYYVVFVDEGRKIGSWKLHDNFYNMNSISEIQVVKSRKIAADTCSITMNNMFNSYTTDADITTSQQYLDVYGLKDVFDSIFSPKAYFEKEKALRLRQTVPDKVQLEPGIRIHVRMGYSGDGSKLPVVFNGKVAEVSVGDVAQIIAQGDGHELMNPLNAFGEMEVTSLDPAQTSCTWAKDIRGSLAKGGETPRDLLAKLLTAKYGGWRKILNNEYDGRWWNDNPFGIMHFGDPKYNDIFDLGEPVQNLYEVSDEALIKGTNELGVSKNSSKISPIINTSLQDKTLWDILHLCANSGLGYIGAIRDFGFRSTIFLGKPNHYYAHEYALVDNKVVEKRKPFQQFHYYDSYNDIIYNSIKASESQMRTNAVGLWQASSPLWGREQSTVGPIYLDMNIYPEYQKSMTVDTGLLADGNGGIDIPPITHLGEKWNMNANDDKVNKSLAWRVTANALRDSVKDMYQGDVCVIGDPSVKPHDRVFIYDTYEDMQGMFEVEAVVHNMSGTQGYTTSIMPDVIARHQDEQEASVQGLGSLVFSQLMIGVTSVLGHNLFLASVNNKLAKTIAKSKNMYGMNKKLNEYAKNLGNATSMLDYLDEHPATKRLFESLNFLPGDDNLHLNRFTYLMDDLAKISLNDIDKSFDDFIKAFNLFKDFNPDEFAESMLEAYQKDKYGLANKHTEDDIKKAASEMQLKYKEFEKQLNTSLKNVDLKAFKDEIYSKGLEQSLSPSSRKILKEIAENEITDKNKIKLLGELLQDEDLSKIIKKGDIKLSGIDEAFDGLKGVIKGIADKDVLKILKGGNVIEDLMSVIIRAAKLNYATILMDIAMSLTIEIFIRNTKETFTRWLQSIQAIDVYPLKRNGKPLIAGMNGNKGSVAMYPVNDGYNSIQGMVIETVQAIKKMNWGDKWFTWGDWLLDMFVDKDILEQLTTDWRRELGIEDPDNPDNDTNTAPNEYHENFNQNVYNELGAAYANYGNGYALMTKNRIVSYDTNKGKDSTYKHYEIKNITSKNITNNEKIKKLHYLQNDDIIQKAIIEEKFVISHSKGYNKSVNIPFEDGNVNIPVVVTEKGVIDTPLVQEEVIYILQELLSDKNLKGIIHFKSGARFNDTRTWKNTGFSFILEYQGSDNNLEEALEKVRDKTAYKINDGKNKIKRNMFSYKKYSSTPDDDVSSEASHGDKFVIIVYAPTYITE